MKIKYSVFLTQKIGSPSEKDNPILIRESAKRFPTYAFEPHDMFLDNGKPMARAWKVIVGKKGELSVNIEKPTLIDLNDGCLINIRLDPPFDTRYVTALYMLSKVGKRSYVTNSAQGILNMPEKIIPDELKDHVPATLVSNNEDEILKFWKKHGDIIIKPLYEYGGKGVFRLKKGEENYKSILFAMHDRYKEPIVAQKFIPEVKKGDKRIILIDGEIYGAVLRIPAKGQIQASVTLGGSFVKCGVNANEKDICRKLRPLLKKNDIFLCGIDVIGEYLTEINVTCPSIAYLMNHSNKDTKNYVPAEKIYWDRLEEKVSKH